MNCEYLAASIEAAWEAMRELPHGTVSTLTLVRRTNPRTRQGRWMVTLLETSTGLTVGSYTAAATLCQLREDVYFVLELEGER